MPSVFHHHLFVTADDVDVVGHVNNVTYLHWMQAAALAHSAAQGWPTERYLQLGQGWVARQHSIEYLKPAFSGDRVIVRTWVADLKRVTSLRRYRIVRAGAGPADADQETVLAIASTDWAFIHFATGAPKRIPPEVRGAFEIVAD